MVPVCSPWPISSMVFRRSHLCYTAVFCAGTSLLPLPTLACGCWRRHCGPTDDIELNASGTWQSLISSTCSRFELFFVEPLAHTVLNGLIRTFLVLILHSATNQGLVVDGASFFIALSTQRKMDAIITQLKRHGSFGRPFSTISECAPPPPPHIGCG